jgi:hypothetical protein
MVPVCNDYASLMKSGHCIMVMDNDWKFANMKHLEKQAGDKAARGFEFTFAYQVPTPAFNNGRSMGYANSNQKQKGSGFVACTTSAAAKSTIELERYTLKRVPFKGKSTNTNLEKACVNGTKPVCAYGPYSTGACQPIHHTQ